MAERVARVLKLLGVDRELLGVDRDLLGTDSYELLELIDDYCADDSEAHGEGIEPRPLIS